jgi:hypothetical protein
MRLNRQSPRNNLANFNPSKSNLLHPNPPHQEQSSRPIFNMSITPVSERASELATTSAESTARIESPVIMDYSFEGLAWSPPPTTPSDSNAEAATALTNGAGINASSTQAPMNPNSLMPTMSNLSLGSTPGVYSPLSASFPNVARRLSVSGRTVNPVNIIANNHLRATLSNEALSSANVAAPHSAPADITQFNQLPSQARINAVFSSAHGNTAESTSNNGASPTSASFGNFNTTLPIRDNHAQVNGHANHAQVNGYANHPQVNGHVASPTTGRDPLAQMYTNLHLSLAARELCAGLDDSVNGLEMIYNQLVDIQQANPGTFDIFLPVFQRINEQQAAAREAHRRAEDCLRGETVAPAVFGPSYIPDGGN